MMLCTIFAPIPCVVLYAFFSMSKENVSDIYFLCMLHITMLFTLSIAMIT